MALPYQHDSTQNLSSYQKTKDVYETQTEDDMTFYSKYKWCIVNKERLGRVYIVGLIRFDEGQC